MGIFLLRTRNTQLDPRSTLALYRLQFDPSKIGNELFLERA